MLRWIAIAGIKFYQHVFSPRKGFVCAHNALYQQGGCSSRVLKHIKDKPLTQWYSSYKSEVDACKVAYAQIQKRRKEKDKNKRKWCGDATETGCDCGLEVVDCPDLSCDCDIGSC